MYQTMVRALTALHRARPSPEYIGIACLISCYMDAIAAKGGEATAGKYEKFLRKNFGQLCAGLRRETGRDGAKVFRAQYRTKMAHNYFTPDPGFALAEDAELGGKYAGRLVIGGRTLIAINVERLYKDFVTLARNRAKAAGTRRGAMGDGGAEPGGA